MAIIIALAKVSLDTANKIAEEVSKKFGGDIIVTKTLKSAMRYPGCRYNYGLKIFGVSPLETNRIKAFADTLAPNQNGNVAFTRKLRE